LNEFPGVLDEAIDTRLVGMRKAQALEKRQSNGPTGAFMTFQGGRQ